jgi:hypothetical protein
MTVKAGTGGKHGMNNDEAKQPLNPNALTVADASRLLTKVGGDRVTDEMLRADLASGAPTNPDGTMNLVHYAAWLVKEMGRGE